MKYCPGPSCPHRSRVHAPAEFLDTIVVCSDCGTELVRDLDLAPAEIALATRGEAGSYSVYRKAQRGGLRRRENQGDPERARRVAKASLVGGIGFMAIGCALVSWTGGRQNLLLLGPLFFAAYRFVQANLDVAPRAKKAAKKR